MTRDRALLTIRTLRWLMRLWSAASIAFVLMFVIGDLVNPTGSRPPTPSEWLQLLLFPVGVLAGLALGWRRETLGGAIVAACFLAFYAVEIAASGSFPRGPWFALVAAPGFGFLVLGVLDRRPSA